MKYITTLILMVFIAGCAPYMTYYEMEAAYEIAETEEEKQELMAKIETFENNVDKAEVFFDNRRACNADRRLVWFCDNVQAVDENRIKGLDGLVRAYKREHQSCGCTKVSDMRINIAF